MGRAKQEWEEAQEQEARGYKLDHLIGKCTCVDHFTNEYLKAKVNHLCRQGVCSYCGRNGKIIDMERLMQYVCEKIVRYMGPIDNEYLYYTRSFVGRDDDELPEGWEDYNGYLKPKDATVYETADALTYDFGLVTDCGDLNDDIDQCFIVNSWIRRDPVSLHRNKLLQYSWEDFERRITRAAEESATPAQTPAELDNLFKTARINVFVDDLITPIILPECASSCMMLVRPYPAGTILYRCRPDDNRVKYDTFSALTAPPAPFAKANRLNMAGESVFYGSFDRMTPVREVMNYSSKTNPPTISEGEFRTKRDLRLIDFRKIPKPDFWMPGDQWQVSKFLPFFHDAITKPIDHQLQEIEYLPTQAFAKELRDFARRNNIDGMIYQSSLTGQPNVCLFYDNAASASILDLVSAF